MGTILQGATLVEFEPASVERADLRIDGGRIVARGADAAPQPGDEVVDLSGRLVVPGLVSAQHRPYAMALRGRPRRGAGFLAEQGLLEAAESCLTADDLEALTAAAALEGLQAGVTSAVFSYQLPKPEGSPARVAAAVGRVGLRGVVACEVSDRFGALAREEALEVATGFARSAQGRVRGAIGLAGLGTLSTDALNGVRAAFDAQPVPMIITLGEDPGEEKASMQRFEAQPVDRLLDAGLVTPKTVLTHLANLSWPELSRTLGTGAWLAHGLRSNLAAQAGLATAAKFGVRGCLATGTASLDVLDEARVAWLRSHEADLAIDALRFLANGARLAGDVFGMPLGMLRPDSGADLVVLDYAPVTPVNAGTLGQHVVTGLSSRAVESVMIDGVWRLWKRRPLTVDPAEVTEVARRAADVVWNRVKHAA